MTSYVPIGPANDYKSNYPWNFFNNIVEKEITEIKSINNAQKIYTSDKSIIIENYNHSINNIKVYSNGGVLVKSIYTDKKYIEILINDSGMYIVKRNTVTQKGYSETRIQVNNATD